MSIIEWFNGLDKRFAWSFLGFLLAAIFGSISIYTEFFRVDRPSLIIEILNDTNVLDVKEKVNELKILYDDIDIQNLNKTLSVLIIRIRNSGGAPILNGYYDKKYPLRLSLSDGKFLKVEQATSTSDYLLNSAIPIIETEKTIMLPEIILEPGESYTIKSLILHAAESNINLNVSGKIAGVHKIELLRSSSEETSISYWKEVFNGNIFVQLVRLPTYFFGFILIIAILIITIAFASDKISKKRRKRIVKQYKSYAQTELSDYHQVIFESYIEDGVYPLAQAKEVLSDESYLIKMLNYKETGEKTDQSLPPLPTGTQVALDNISDHIMTVRKYVRSMELLKKMGAIAKTEGDIYSISNEVESILGKFIDFVVIKES